MILNAINNYVTVDLIEPKSVGLIKPNQAEKTVRWGRVTSVGPGLVSLAGTLIEPDMKVGQLVYVMAHGKHEVDLSMFGAKNGVICSMLDLLAYMEDEENMKIKPLGNYVEIEKLEASTVSAGGLTLPESNRTPPNLGVVKTLGLGWVSIDGTRVPFHVKEEDTIVYDPYKVMIVDLEHLGVNKSLHLIQHGNIMGIVEE